MSLPSHPTSTVSSMASDPHLRQDHREPPTLSGGRRRTHHHTHRQRGRRELYAKTVKKDPSEPDSYTMTGRKKTYTMTPELNMLFPVSTTISTATQLNTATRAGYKGSPVEATIYVDRNGNPIQKQLMNKPTFAENLNFFINYRAQPHVLALLHVELCRTPERHPGQWRGEPRQPDLGHTLHRQSPSGRPKPPAPAEGSENKGHNVFFMLPLILES